MKKSFPPAWRAVAVSACCCSPAGALALYTPSRRATRPFSRRWDNCATLTFDDKDKIVDQLAQSGHPSARAVLTALLRRSPLLPQPGSEDFPRQSRGEEDSTTLDLIDPLTLKAAGSASVDDA